MSFKCPDCGASLTDDSKFCKYCGAKIDDGVKRIEVKIDQHIEDAAEMKRAGYEEKESLLRQKRMKQELRRVKTKRITLLILLVVFGVPTIIGIVANEGDAIPIGIICFIPAVCVAIKIIVDLIRGKW